MKKFLLSTLAVVFPWIIMLIDDNPGGAVLALILQATILGWIPSSMWALRVVRENILHQKGTGKPSDAAKKARAAS